MPSSPNTPAVLSAIQTKAQGLLVGGSQFFPTGNAIIGKLKDASVTLPLFEVTLLNDLTKRYEVAGVPTQGGQIDDSQEYLCEITLDNSDSQNVEAVVLPNIRDAFTSAFHASVLLNLAGQVADSRLMGQGKYGYTYRNGEWRRAYKQILKVRYEYYVVMTP